MLIALTLPLALQAQEEAPGIPLDSFLVRVENARFGRVEVSLDGGVSYSLLGRVQHPATAPEKDRSSKVAGDAKSISKNRLSFAVAPTEILLLSPEVASGKSGRQKLASARIPASEIVTDIAPEKSLFDCFPKSQKIAVLLQSGIREPSPLPSGYVVHLGDTFVFRAPIISAEKKPSALGSDSNALKARYEEIAGKLRSYSNAYASSAIDRAKRSKRKIVSGLLRLVPKLPENEPEPITTLSYAMDGEVIALHNSLPSVFIWDTTRLTNGEHLIEIRAMSQYATLISTNRILIVVNNANNADSPQTEN